MNEEELLSKVERRLINFDNVKNVGDDASDL